MVKNKIKIFKITFLVLSLLLILFLSIIKFQGIKRRFILLKNLITSIIYSNNNSQISMIDQNNQNYNMIFNITNKLNLESISLDHTYLSNSEIRLERNLIKFITNDSSDSFYKHVSIMVILVCNV